MSGQMVTANRLQDGLVVYLTQGGDWADQFTSGAVLPDQPAAEAALATADRAVKDRVIVGPYLIDVLVDGGAVKPTSTRERIRADRGPTIVVDAGTWSGRIGD
jgi:hypothetical protein